MAAFDPTLVSAAIEDYAKALYALDRRGRGRAVSTNDLADLRKA